MSGIRTFTNFDGRAVITRSNRFEPQYDDHYVDRYEEPALIAGLFDDPEGDAE